MTRAWVACVAVRDAGKKRKSEERFGEWRGRGGWLDLKNCAFLGKKNPGYALLIDPSEEELTLHLPIF